MKTKRHIIIAMAVLGMFFIFSPLLHAEITRGPYLQPTEDMEHTVGVAWRTANGGTSTISYGINDVSENSITVEPEEAQEGDTTVYKYYINLQNLTPGGIYKYKIEGDGDVEPEPGQGSHDSDYYEFKTSPPDGRFKVLVLSDMFFGRPASFIFKRPEIYTDMLEFAPELVILDGNNVYLGDTNPSSYEEMFMYCKKLFASSIVAPVPDHTCGQNQDLLYVKEYYLPENGPEDQKEILYSFDYGKVHFVTLQEMWRPLNLSWLDTDLTLANQRLVNFIIVGNYLYTLGHSASTYMDWEPCRTCRLDGERNAIYDKHGVDIEFRSNQEYYQRSYPIINNNFDITQWGVVTTPDKEYYGANIPGTIYHLNRIMRYGNRYPGCPGPYFAQTIPDSTVPYMGYTTLTFEGKVCTADTYGYNYYTPNSPAEHEDHYVIDKTDLSEPPTPVISNVNVTEVGAHRAVIEWQTDMQASGGLVEFGTSSGNYNYLNARENQNQIFTTSHKAVLQCLAPGTTYYFRAKAHYAGKEGVSGERSFTTPPQAQQGELVAEFDFGPLSTPSYGARVTWADFDSRTRNGWYTKKPIPYPWIPKGVENSRLQDPALNATDSYCYVGNSYEYQATWRTELPPGEYDIEITSGKAGSWPALGDTKIDIEDGKLVFEKEMPPGIWYDRLNTLYTFEGSVNIEDGFLDVELGYGDSNYRESTIINSLKIWTKGHYPPGYKPDVTEPALITDLKASVISDDSVTLTWTAPGDDGNVGQAKSYDIRYHSWSVNDCWWGEAIQVEGEPGPQTAGAPESFTVTGLVPGRQYEFAMRTIDDMGNFSPISNVVYVINPLTLNVSLSAQPVSGEAPLNEITLTATVQGNAEGDINYYFYSERSDASLWIGSPEATCKNISDTTKTVTLTCNYTTPRTYYAKVIVEKGGLKAENRVSIIVTPPSPTLPGDVNGNGKVDLTDLVIVAWAFGSTPASPNWDVRADIADPRGVIDISDLVVVAVNFGRTA